VASATSLANSLKGELAEGQRNLVVLAENASASAVHSSLIAKQMNLPDKVNISFLDVGWVYIGD
jgi:enhancer of mRNA-decapping protein 4